MCVAFQEQEGGGLLKVLQDYTCIAARCHEGVRNNNRDGRDMKYMNTIKVQSLSQKVNATIN